MNPPASGEDAPRPNPEPFQGSLIWWAETPAGEQNYLQAVLEAYPGMGYYQTMERRWREGEGGKILSLGRFTSTEDARKDLSALLDALGEECGLRLLERAPDILPDHQPDPSPREGDREPSAS